MVSDALLPVVPIICQEQRLQKKPFSTSYGGTHGYRSPQSQEEEKHSCKTDIWSTGATLLSLAEGYTQDGLFTLQDQRLHGHALNFSRIWTPDFLDFLDLTLKYDPDERLPAQALLEHPWIVKNAPTDQEAHLCIANLLAAFPHPLFLSLSLWMPRLPPRMPYHSHL